MLLSITIEGIPYAGVVGKLNVPGVQIPAEPEAIIAAEHSTNTKERIEQ